MKVQQRGATKERSGQCFAQQDYKEMPRLGPCRRTNGGKHLSIGEKIKIVHEVLVQHRLQREVAVDYKVTVAEVCALSRKAMKNREFINELISRRDQVEQRR